MDSGRGRAWERLFLGLGEREVEASFIEALACDLWFQPNPESVLALSHKWVPARAGGVHVDTRNSFVGVREVYQRVMGTTVTTFASRRTWFHLLSPSGPLFHPLVLRATPTHPDSKRVVGEWVVRGEDSYLPDSLSPWDTTRYTRDALGLPGERILKVTKKSGNRGRCRKLSLWNWFLVRQLTCQTSPEDSFMISFIIEISAIPLLPFFQAYMDGKDYKKSYVAEATHRSTVKSFWQPVELFLIFHHSLLFFSFGILNLQIIIWFQIRKVRVRENENILKKHSFIIF